MGSEGKWTPGPWAVAEGDVYRAEDIAAGHKPGALAPIAQVYGTTCEEHEANTRLIAAAPELLAALEHIAVWDGEPKDNHESEFEEGYNAGRIYAREIARAVIRKATEPTS